MKERLKRLLPKVVFPIFYVFCLVVFSVMTFPYDRLKERIVTQFNQQQQRSSAPQELSIDELDSWWITGVRAKGVRLTTPSPEPDKPPIRLEIDEAKARISILPLLVGKRAVSYNLSLADGTVSGSYEESGKDRAVEVVFDGVDVGRVGPVTAQLGVPLDGKIHGSIKLQLPEGKASKGTGAINLDIRDMAVGDGKAKIKNMLALPKLQLGTIALVAEAKDGTLKVSKLGASGKDVDLNGEGRIQMKELATEALLEMSIKFKIGDAYRKKNEQTKMIFGEPGSKIPPLFDSVSQMKPGLDGYYAFNLRGTLGNPKTSSQNPTSSFGAPRFGGGGSGGL